MTLAVEKKIEMEINERASTSDGPLSPPFYSSNSPVPEEIRQLSAAASEKFRAYLHGHIQGFEIEYVFKIKLFFHRGIK
jgi:hypothetical protein